MAQQTGEKRENSVLFALRDLRQIEENRVQEEELAVRSAEEARQRAQEAEERRRREDEEARVRAERDHQQRIEDARLGAEREARMRVEAAEAAERNRIQGDLEQQRLHHEMEIRRAEVAKKRPTWMLVVTGFALVAAVVLVIFTVKAITSRDESDTQAQKDRAAKEAAEKEKEQLLEKVARLEGDLKSMAKSIDDATDGLAQAQNDADRASARAKLDKLRAERADMERKIAEARAAAAHRERMGGVHLRQECIDNPLAKGC